VNYEGIHTSMLEDHQIVIGGAFGYLKNKVLRIGHMGENSYEEKIYKTLKALDMTFKKYKLPIVGNLHEWYVTYMNQ
jgi:aspartate aminotransferase-like enzyme